MMPLVMANEAGRAHAANLEALRPPNCSLERRHRPRPSLKSLGTGYRRGESPVPCRIAAARCVFAESGCLGLQLELGGKFHLKLNTGS